MPTLNDWPHQWAPAAPGAPVVVALHGTGADEHQFDVLRRVLPGHSLLAPRGLSRDEGINRWFRRLREGVFDLDDLARRSAELEAFMTEAAAHYGFDLSASTWLGYSNGANIAGSVLLRGQVRPRAAALLHPMVPFEPNAMPDLSGLRLLLTQGSGDPTMPPGHAEAVEALYRRTGAQVDSHTHAYGHSLTPQEFEAVVNWMAST